MVEPIYTGTTLKDTISKNFIGGASDIIIHDGTVIDGEEYLAITTTVFNSNVMKIIDEDYEVVLSERRDANTRLFQEDGVKQAKRLFEELKKRKGNETG